MSCHCPQQCPSCIRTRRVGFLDILIVVVMCGPLLALALLGIVPLVQSLPRAPLVLGIGASVGLLAVFAWECGWFRRQP